MTPPAPWRPALEAALRAAGDQPAARYAQLATVRPDGRPANRTVVFRGFQGDDGLLFTTDTRSEKALHLGVSPWAEVCWYFHETREQFRLFGRAEADPEGSAADRAALWHALPGPTRQTFTWPAPGAPRADDADFTRPEPDEPPAAFGLIVARPVVVDHLDLHPHPHERTVYRHDGSAWLVERVNP